MPATPTTSDEKTSGTTIISSRLRNSVPIGCVMLLTMPRTFGSVPPSDQIDGETADHADEQADQDLCMQRHSLRLVRGLVVEIGIEFAFVIVGRYLVFFVIAHASDSSLASEDW